MSRYDRIVKYNTSLEDMITVEEKELPISLDEIDSGLVEVQTKIDEQVTLIEKSNNVGVIAEALDNQDPNEDTVAIEKLLTNLSVCKDIVDKGSSYRRINDKISVEWLGIVQDVRDGAHRIWEFILELWRKLVAWVTGRGRVTAKERAIISKGLKDDEVITKLEAYTFNINTIPLDKLVYVSNEIYTKLLDMVKSPGVMNSLKIADDLIKNIADPIDAIPAKKYTKFSELGINNKQDVLTYIDTIIDKLHKSVISSSKLMEALKKSNEKQTRDNEAAESINGVELEETLKRVIDYVNRSIAASENTSKELRRCLLNAYKV